MQCEGLGLLHRRLPIRTGCIPGRVVARFFGTAHWRVGRGEAPTFSPIGSGRTCYAFLWGRESPFTENVARVRDTNGQNTAGFAAQELRRSLYSRLFWMHARTKPAEFCRHKSFFIRSGQNPMDNKSLDRLASERVPSCASRSLRLARKERILRYCRRRAERLRPRQRFQTSRLDKLSPAEPITRAWVDLPRLGQIQPKTRLQAISAPRAFTTPPPTKKCTEISQEKIPASSLVQTIAAADWLAKKLAVADAAPVNGQGTTAQ